MSTETAGVVTKSAGYHAMYGRYMGTLSSSSEVNTYYILRPDILDEESNPDSATLFLLNQVGDVLKTCSVPSTYNPYSDGYSNSPLRDVITTEYEYNSLTENVEFNGQICTRYTLSNDQATVHVYADSDSHVVGLSTTTETTHAEYNITYEMVAYEGQFKVDSSFSGCEDYSAVFTKPSKEDDCPLQPGPAPAPPTGSGSSGTQPPTDPESASAIKAGVALVLASMAITFISLF